MEVKKAGNIVEVNEEIPASHVCLNGGKSKGGVMKKYTTCHPFIRKKRHHFITIDLFGLKYCIMVTSSLIQVIIEH